MRVRIDRADSFRVLLTELLPYEVPMLFSNEGFYKIVRQSKHENIFRKIKDNRNINNFSIPFNYGISKGVDSGSRLLSVMHPSIQIEFASFYERYDALLEYNCQQSPYSLRRVDRIAKYTYSSDLVFEEDDTLKSAEAEILRTDDLNSMVYKSYFRYEPIDLIYKFYDRFDYRRLEQRFTYLLKFDISRCFYNIYTHSITWAIKRKEIAKKRVGRVSFENDFDKIMQRSNYNETNGILVGPEISRIFAEIILSRIDSNVKKILSDKGLKQAQDYDIRRYVDDYFIYTNSEQVTQKIHNCLKSELEKYKLYSNDAKNEFHRTPFVSKLSIAKQEVKELVDYFTEQIFVIKPIDDEKFLSIRKKSVRSPYGLSGEIIKKFQFIVRKHDLSYDQLNKDLIRLLAGELRRLQKKAEPCLFKKEKYGNFLLAFMQILFYAYSLGMNASSTFKVSRCIVLICKSLEDAALANRENLMMKLISEVDFVMNIYLSKSAPDDTNVNILNLLIAMSMFDDRYLLPKDKLQRMLRLEEEKRELNYFEICTLLYYINTKSEYQELFDLALQHSENILGRVDRFTYSEGIMLFLDLIACPYVNNDIKRRLCKLSRYVGQNTSHSDTDACIKEIADCKTWFFNWDNEVNLEAALKKKEWSSVY